MSIMNAVIFSLLCFVGQTLSLPLPAGGNRSQDLFYCEDAGCAANVSLVYCNGKKPVFENKEITDCNGRPSLHHVCQHHGRAFVSALKGVRCEFEGLTKNIQFKINTEKCTDVDTICSFTPTTSPPFTTSVTSLPPSSNGFPKEAFITIAVICGVGLSAVVIALIRYCIKKQTPRSSQPSPNDSRNPDEEIPLQEIQTSGGNNESSTRGDEEPDGNTFPQRGRGD